MRLYFVKGKITGLVVCAGHWLAQDNRTAIDEFVANIIKNNSDPAVIEAGLNRDLSGIAWEATPSRGQRHNAVNYKERNDETLSHI
jgi:hypothetical protein